MGKSYEVVRTGTGVGFVRDGSVVSVPMILGIGRNYAEHAKEQGAEVPKAPMVFTKNLASACLSGDAIVVPRVCRDAALGGDQTDFEGELAVVIGERTRDVAKGEVFSSGSVLGYCVANDVSARWWQKQGSGGQFFRGKSFDTFCPLGPRVTAASEIRDPQRLRLVTKVNGQVMQDAATSDMIFDVATLVSDLSRGMTLLPGTVILTGTPSGVGMARTPPVWLKEGDEVEVEIEGLGAIRNRVTFE